MPQLDRIIVFTQIFWLFLVFFILYVILTHFFLPKFLQSLKSRNLVVECNIIESSNIKSNLSLCQTSLSVALNEQLLNVKQVLFDKFIGPVKDKFCLVLTTNLLFKPIIHTTLYCDMLILHKIPLKSKIYNFTYKN